MASSGQAPSAPATSASISDQGVSARSEARTSGASTDRISGSEKEPSQVACRRPGGRGAPSRKRRSL